MEKIKLIIFDLDGTLVDAYEAITRSFNYTMAKTGYPKQKASVIFRAVGWGDINLIKPFVRKEDLKKAMATYREHHTRALLRYAHLFPGVKALLRYLKNKGYMLGVASNRPTAFARILMRHLGIMGYFDYCLSADKLKHGKPHPEIILRIMRRLTTTSDENPLRGRYGN